MFKFIEALKKLTGMIKQLNDEAQLMDGQDEINKKYREYISRLEKAWSLMKLIRNKRRNRMKIEPTKRFTVVFHNYK